MDTVPALPEFIEELRASGVITADNVLELRRAIFPDGIVSPFEADAIFRLDHDCLIKDPTWTQFYVDGLTDYFLWQSEPRGYVDDGLAKALIANITRDGKIDALSELELLLNIVHWATYCPDDLAMLSLDAVRRSVVSSGDAVYGSNRPENLITAGDVAIIRKVIHAPGGDGSIAVTRREAEMIFDLNEAVQGQETCPEWQELFATAIANHLMFPRPAPEIPSADEALRREAWLEEKPGFGKMLAGIGQALAGGDLPFMEAWHSFDPIGAERARREAEAEDQRVREALAREAIDAEEAKWLSARILSDGQIDENERALLAFIKTNASHIDSSLDDLFAQAGI